MKPLTQFTKDYFSKFSNRPVNLTPFDPISKIIAKDFIKQLYADLADWSVTIKIIGSTAYEIAGKGSIEIGIFTHGKDRDAILFKLEELYKPMEVKEQDFAEFHHEVQGRSIKVMILSGYAATVNKKMYDFFLNHPDMTKKYEDMKRRFSHSEQEYQEQKQEFLNEIIEELPEEQETNHE
jgi:GrpB-like predicted nucleotidyltransferase (UPF0157 family)